MIASQLHKVTAELGLLTPARNSNPVSIGHAIYAREQNYLYIDHQCASYFIIAVAAINSTFHLILSIVRFDFANIV